MSFVVGFKMIERLARYKNYLARSNGYISLATFGMVLWNIVPNWWYPLALFSGVFIMLFAGYLDCKLGLFKEENRHITNQNPVLMEILNEVKKK